MKLPGKSSKTRLRRNRAAVAPEAAPKPPEPAAFAATLAGLKDALDMLRGVAETEAGAVRHPDAAVASELQRRKNAITRLLRDATAVIAAAQQGGMAIDAAGRAQLMAQCQSALGALQVNCQAIAAARSAAHRRIQSVLQARQRAEGAILVYGPSGEARSGGRWTDRRDLAPGKA